MLDRTSWWLLGTCLLIGCAAGYPEARSSTRASGSGERAGTAERIAAEDPDGEPETWAESLDAFVFGDPSAPRTGGARSGHREDAPDAADARGLAAAGARALEEGRTEDAFESFRAAHDAAPGDRRWIYLRVMANICTGLRRDQTALELYLELQEMAPQAAQLDETLHGNLALVYYRLDRLPEARKEVMRALALNPEFPEALRTLRLIEVREGRVESGIDLLERAVGLKRNIPEAQVALAEHEEAAGLREEASGRYRYLLEIMESEGFQDPLGRWRYLFGTAEPPTADECRRRIQRLESGGESPDNARR